MHSNNEEIYFERHACFFFSVIDIRFLLESFFFFTTSYHLMLDHAVLAAPFALFELNLQA
jgi:hypothetical protein